MASTSSRLWGYDNEGEVGNGGAFNATGIRPEVKLAGTYTKVSMSGYNVTYGAGNTVYALKSDGTLWAWGLNNQG